MKRIRTETFSKIRGPINDAINAETDGLWEYLNIHLFIPLISEINFNTSKRDLYENFKPNITRIQN